MTSHSECKLASVVTSKCPLCGDTELPITCCVNMQGKKSLKFVVCRSMNLMSCKQLIKDDHMTLVFFKYNFMLYFSAQCYKALVIIIYIIRNFEELGVSDVY